MIYKTEQGLWQSTLLQGESWLEHEFGTAVTPIPESILTLKQIHSTRVVETKIWHDCMEGDALVAPAGVGVGVKTADCVPILIADPVRRLVAAVHAGWRGTVDGIAKQVIQHLVSEHGSAPGNLLAAMGPSIGPCCFEVGEEVAGLFRDLFPERSDLHARTHLDLREANARQIKRAGLQESKIDFGGAPCTCCGGAEFHSWRRDRVLGLRMYSVIRVRPC